MSNDNNENESPVRRGRKKKRSKKVAATKAAATKTVVTDRDMLNAIRGLLKNKHTAARILKAL